MFDIIISIIAPHFSVDATAIPVQYSVPSAIARNGIVEVGSE